MAKYFKKSRAINRLALTLAGIDATGQYPHTRAAATFTSAAPEPITVSWDLWDDPITPAFSPDPLPQMSVRDAIIVACVNCEEVLEHWFRTGTPGPWTRFTVTSGRGDTR